MWAKSLPVPLFSLAVLVLALYFTIFVTSIWSCLVLVVFSLYFLKNHYQDKKALLEVGIVFALFLIYFSFLYLKESQLQKTVPDQLDQVELVADSISINGEQLSAQGRSQGQSYQVFYRLKSEKEQEFFKHASQPLVLRGKIRLTEPSPQRNFQGFDYKNYLSTQAIYRLAQVEELSSVTKSEQVSIPAYFQTLRRKAIVHIQTHFPHPMRHYMTGLLFGYLDKEFDQESQLYTSLGIIHLFALSGMQVGFFIGWFRYGLLRLGFPRDYLFLVIIPFSMVYGLMTGWTASVLRSLVQAILATFGLKKLDNMGMTLLVLFILLPHYLQTVGGVLSCAYAFLLCLFDFEPLSNWKKSVYTSLLLSLGILPILIYYYGVFQPASLVLTALFSLVFDSFLLPVLTLFFALSGVLVLDQINPFFLWMEGLLTWVHNHLGQALVFGKPNLLQLFILLLILVCLYDFWKKAKIRWLLLLGFGLTMCWVKFPLTNEVTVIDVGQGDSIFLRSIKNETVLIDVGGKVVFGEKADWQVGSQTSNAEKTVIPYLQARGVSRIDHLVLTHTDADHVGDLEELVRAFRIGEICVSQGALTNHSFVSRLKTLSCPVRVLKAGDQLPIMGSRLEVLYPANQGDGGNNDSIVLYGQLLNQRFLFTGDLEKEGEDTLMKSYPQLKVDVLKAGHHGSKGSSSETFLDQIQASTALISAGQNNRYKHPHTETLERFDERGIEVFRTDQEGAIRYTGWSRWHVEMVR